MMIFAGILFVAFFNSVQATTGDKYKHFDLTEHRKFILDLHNELRSKLALGQVPNKNGTLLPKGSNIRKLTYNTSYEQISQEIGALCVLTAKQIKGTFSNGYWEGLDMRASAEQHLKEALVDGIYYWFNESYTMGVMALNNIGNHFSQMSWWDNYQIGCGVTWCYEKADGKKINELYMNCNYYPGGNKLWGGGMYHTGEPCAECGVKDKAFNQYDEKLGLCVNPDIAEIHP